MESSEFYASDEDRPVVSVIAVDMCEQASNASIAVVEIPNDLAEPQQTDGLPTITPQPTHDISTTGNQNLLG